MTIVTRSAVSLIKGIILSPKKILKQIKDDIVHPQSTYLIFAMVMLFLLLKSFLARSGKDIRLELFNEKFLNRIIEILADPFIHLIVVYLLYFVVAFYIRKLAKFLNKKTEPKKIIQMLMALSVLGIIGQPIYLLLNYLSAHNALRIFSILISIWNWSLIFLAVKVSSSLSYKKIALILLIPFIIIGISPLGPWSFMSPYLLFVK